jgi:hypothetical protein
MATSISKIYVAKPDIRKPNQGIRAQLTSITTTSNMRRIVDASVRTSSFSTTGLRDSRKSTAD